MIRHHFAKVVEINIIRKLFVFQIMLNDFGSVILCWFLNNYNSVKSACTDKRIGKFVYIIRCCYNKNITALYKINSCLNGNIFLRIAMHIVIVSKLIHIIKKNDCRSIFVLPFQRWQ